MTSPGAADPVGAEAGSVNCAAIHRKARSISGLHLQLHQDPPPGSRRVRPGALLPGFPAFDSRDDQEPGAQRPNRKDSWAGPLYSPPCATGIPAAIGIGCATSAGLRPSPALLPKTPHANQPVRANHPHHQRPGGASAADRSPGTDRDGSIMKADNRSSGGLQRPCRPGGHAARHRRAQHGQQWRQYSQPAPLRWLLVSKSLRGVRQG